MNGTYIARSLKLELDCVTVVGSCLPPTCLVELHHPLIGAYSSRAELTPY